VGGCLHHLRGSAGVVRGDLGCAVQRVEPLTQLAALLGRGRHPADSDLLNRREFVADHRLSGVQPVRELLHGSRLGTRTPAEPPQVLILVAVCIQVGQRRRPTLRG